MSEVHPCIPRAIQFAVSAERTRKLARHLPGESSTFAFEVRAAALSQKARLALDELGRR